jgi:hypothetical protein
MYFCNHLHVREVADRQTQKCLHSILPFVLQLDAVTTLHIHEENASGDGVESSGTHNVIEFPFLFGSPDASWGEFCDWCFVDVYQMHVRAVELLVEPVLERDTLAAEGMWFLGWCELFPEVFVWETGSYFVAPVIIFVNLPQRQPEIGNSYQNS